MIIVNDLVDKKGRNLSVFCGEDGWIVKFGGVCHYVENQDGFDKNLEKVTEHIKEFFGDVREVKKETA